MQIEEISDYKKGRRKVLLDDGTLWILYIGEIRSCQLKVGVEITEELRHNIQIDILQKRAIKRAMHLLEKMDMTEKKLRDKLLQGEYPKDAIDEAVAYVQKYHYLDDSRYAQNYVQCYQNMRSQKRIAMDLRAKGVDKEIIEQSFESTYEADEREMIIKLLKKKGYQPDAADVTQKRKIYAFLVRRGFRSEDVLRAMKCSDYLT
jgi:regulatory protein